MKNSFNLLLTNEKNGEEHSSWYGEGYGNASEKKLKKRKKYILDWGCERSRVDDTLNA